VGTEIVVQLSTNYLIRRKMFGIEVAFIDEM
jgi:hypothetical protein